MAATSNERAHRDRPSPPRLTVAPIRAGRRLGGAVAKIIRSIGRIREPASQQARGISKDGSGRMRTLRNRSVTSVGQIIGSVRGLSVRAARTIKRPTRRARDLAGAIRPTAATGEPLDRGHALRSRTKTAVTSLGRTAVGRRKAGQTAAPTEQDQVEAKPKARARTRRTRQSRATSRQAKRRQAERTQDLERQTVQELREQARAADIEHRSSMTREQLVEALEREPSPTGSQTETGPYEERTVEELREQATRLGIKGRSSMTKDQLIKALRSRS